jgi:hypothetical protein
MNEGSETEAVGVYPTNLADAEEHGRRAVDLPAPTVWPCAAGAGVALIALGLATTLPFSVAGVTVLALALAGWLKELLRE